MNEKIIKLSDADEVCDFVSAAGKCDFDIDISYQRMTIDAIHSRSNGIGSRKGTYSKVWRRRSEL